MFPLTLREAKGSPLTYQEMDNNLKHVMFPPFLHIQDQKPQGTHGGTFTSGAWRTRDLNTVLTNTITGASLATNQITLPAGKYYVEADVPSEVQTQTSPLSSSRLSSNGVPLLFGTNYRINANVQGSGTNTASRIRGIIKLLNLVDDIIIQHRTSENHTYGTAANFQTEVYSDIRIWCIGDAE